jgi:hypothetical protein
MKSFFKYSKNNVLNDLKNFNFVQNELSDLNSKVLFMNECFQKIVANMTRKKFVNEQEFKNEWYDFECINLKRERDLHGFQYRQNKTHRNWKTYTISRNKYKSLLKKKNSDFHKNKIIKNKNDPKKLWKILKLMYKDKTSKIKSVTFGDQKISNQKLIAEKLNNFYVDSINEIIQNLPSAQNHDFIQLIERNPNKFKFRNVNENQIKSILKKNLNKCFIDGVSGRMIFDCMENEDFAKFFAGIINDSLDLGKVPDDWKISIIEPIEKVKNAKSPDQYRPINKMPVAEKILEIVVKEQLEEFLKENNILVDQQSAFRKNHSCESSINFILHNWKKDLQNDKIIVTVSLDFKRAFETIKRSLLLNIMELYGIRGIELDWFKDYFSNRRQKVKIEENFSNLVPVDNGVSQGTCLGPLTYLLQVNYLPLIMKNATVNMFADDTLLTVVSDNLEDAIEKINEDLKILYDWINYNNLALNINKTKYMIITRKHLNAENVDVKIGGVEIERVPELKYLGVIIDEKLSFSAHLKYIKKKLNVKLAMFRKMSFKLDFSTKVLLYKSLIGPHFDYCSSILFSLSDSQMNELQKIQNKFMRNILKVNRYTRIDQMLDVLGFQSIKQRIAFNSLKLMFKIENGLAPKYLKDLLKKNKEKYQYNLRRKSLYEIPNFTKDYTRNSLFCKTLDLYNECKQKFEPICFNNLKSFCHQLKMFTKEKFGLRRIETNPENAMT